MMTKAKLNNVIDGLLAESYVNGKRIDKLEDKSKYTLEELNKLANKFKQEEKDEKTKSKKK